MSGNTLAWVLFTLTETATLDISFFACSGIGVSTANFSPSAYRQFLVQTPLLCASEAWLLRVCWLVNRQDGVVRAKTDAYWRAHVKHMCI